MLQSIVNPGESPRPSSRAIAFLSPTNEPPSVERNFLPQADRYSWGCLTPPHQASSAFPPIKTDLHALTFLQISCREFKANIIKDGTWETRDKC